MNMAGVSDTPIPPKLVVGTQVGISSNSNSRGSSLSPLVSGATNRVLIGGATGGAFSGKSPKYNPRNPLAGLYSPKANHPATRLLQFQNKVFGKVRGATLKGCAPESRTRLMDWLISQIFPEEERRPCDIRMTSI